MKEKLSLLYSDSLLKSADTFSLGIAVVLFSLIIPDFFLLRENFWTFSILKLSLIFLIFITKKKYVRTNQNFIWWFHAVLLLFSTLCLATLGTSNEILKIIYINIIALVFTLFNSFILWNYKNSLLQALALILVVLFFINVDVIKDEQFFSAHGGYILFTLILTTSLLPKIKKYEFEIKANQDQSRNDLIENSRIELEKKQERLKNTENAYKASQLNYQTTFDDIDIKMKDIHHLSLVLENTYSDSTAQTMKQKISEINLMSAEIISKNKLLLTSIAEQKKYNQANPNLI